MSLILAFITLTLAFVVQPAAVPPSASDVELPMKMRGLMPAVEVKVNGKGPFLFAIDTGAQGEARLDTTLVEKLGLNPTGEVRAGDGSGQNTRMLPTFTVDSIEIGKLAFKNITALSRNYNTAPGVEKIDGILGFGLFADYLLKLDYPGRKVIVSKGSLARSTRENIVPFDNSRGIVSIDLIVGEQKVKAHIDSGNMNGGFMLPAELIQKSKLATDPIIVGRAKTISNEIEIKQVKLKDSIRIGTFEFVEPLVNFPSFGAANIGGKILNDLVLTFDQKNQLVELVRRSK